MNVIMTGHGSTKDNGMNTRYFTNPFEVGDKVVQIEVGEGMNGGAFFTLYETDKDGICRGNVQRMIDAGLWERDPELESVLNVCNIPEYTEDAITDTIRTIYPEVNFETVLFF